MAAYGVMRRGLCAPKRVVDGGPRHVITRSTEIGNLVADLRRGLKIRQEDLAARAGVGRQWITALEQGKPTLEVAMVFRTLEALGFELWVSPYDPAPPWMLRACADAAARQKTLAAGRRARRNTRRAKAREARLGKNEVWGRAEVE